MRFRFSAPDPSLRGLVHGYWELENLHRAGEHEHYELPERIVRLTFSTGDSWAGAVTGELERAAPVSLTRLSLRPQRFVLQGRVRALVAELYPWGARRLLGWSAEDVPGELDHALSGSTWGREVVALLGLSRWDEARGTLEARLISLAGAAGDEPGKGVRAAVQIYQSLGAARVGDLAEELDLSPRTLERLFAQQVGVGAKTLARLVRFDEAHSRLRQDPGVPMAELTYALGFFDQAHLIKEFRALASMTPGAFATLAAQRMNSGLLRQEDDPSAEGEVYANLVPEGR